jgi:hypothetical protein
MIGNWLFIAACHFANICLSLTVFSISYSLFGNASENMNTLLIAAMPAMGLIAFFSACYFVICMREFYSLLKNPAPKPVVTTVDEIDIT